MENNTGPPLPAELFVASYNYLNRCNLYDCELAHLAERIHGWKYNSITKTYLYNGSQMNPWLRRRIVEIRRYNFAMFSHLVMAQYKKNLGE